MGRGDGAKFEHLLGPVDDLCLQLVGRGHSYHITPCMESDWEHGQMEEEILLRGSCACDGARFGIPIILFAQRRPIHMCFFPTGQKDIPIII